MAKLSIADMTGSQMPPPLPPPPLSLPRLKNEILTEKGGWLIGDLQIDWLTDYLISGLMYSLSEW